MKAKHVITVAPFLDVQIAVSDLPQKDIAAALGYDNPNVITMFKQGRTKLPLNKVGPLARVLGIDPVHLLRLVMAEYWPDTWKELQDLVGKSLVTEGEMTIIRLVREVCGDIDLSLETTAHRNAFSKVIGDIAAEQFRLSLKRSPSSPKPKHR